MEISIDTIIAIAGLLLGGGGGAFFTWKWQKRKAKAEAESVVQDVYQQLIADIKADREEQKQYIGELKEDRLHLRSERNELRKRQDELEEQVRELQKAVALNDRRLECMRPFLCGREGCAKRMPVTISDAGVAEVQPTNIEPLDIKDI